MKGKLHKTIKGQWVVRVVSEDTPECDTIIEQGKQLPVHPDYVKYYFLDEDADGGEVEFEIVNKLWGINDDIISYAKLIKPGTGSKVDLQKLEAKLDKILSEETPESFHKWLESKRGPIRNYHSPKIDGMLKEIEEDNLPTTTSDLIDAAIWDLPFDNRIKAWDLIEQLVKEETQNLYTEEQVREVIGKAQILNHNDEFLFTEEYLIQSLKNKKD